MQKLRARSPGLLSNLVSKKAKPPKEQTNSTEAVPLITPTLDPKDIELREGLKWQHGAVDAIFAYIDAVPAAFQTLAEAHERLSEAGISIFDDAADETSLLERLREATNHISEVVSLLREPLKTMRGTIQMCYDDLGQADSAMSEHRRYSHKVEVLTTDNEKRRSKSGNSVAKPKSPQSSSSLTSPMKVPARLSRNQKKMENGAVEASVRQARARDLLLAVSSRQDTLVDSIGQVCCSVVKAVGIASGSFPVVQNVDPVPLVHPLGPLNFNYGVIPQLPRPPSSKIAHEVHAADAHVPPIHVLQAEGAPVATIGHLSSMVCQHGSARAGEFSIRPSKLADELEAYGEGVAQLLKVEADEPTSAGDMSLIDDDAHDIGPLPSPPSPVISNVNSGAIPRDNAASASGDVASLWPVVPPLAIGTVGVADAAGRSQSQTDSTTTEDHSQVQQVFRAAEDTDMAIMPDVPAEKSRPLKTAIVEVLIPLRQAARDHASTL